MKDHYWNDGCCIHCDRTVTKYGENYRLCDELGAPCAECLCADCSHHDREHGVCRTDLRWRVMNPPAVFRPGGELHWIYKVGYGGYPKGLMATDGRESKHMQFVRARLELYMKAKRRYKIGPDQYLLDEFL